MAHTLFFDLDGTLTDPFVGITGSIRFALERLGFDAPDPSELAWCIGPPLSHTFERLVGADLVSAAIARYRERFGSIGLYENQPYPDIHQTLSTLQRAQLRLCVASSKPRVYVRQILEHFELDGYFEHVFGSELDGTRTDKSELLRFALAEARVEPDDATMIGDRMHDIVGAIDNGLAHVAVLYGYGSQQELREAGAIRFAKAPRDIAGHFV